MPDVPRGMRARTAALVLTLVVLAAGGVAVALGRSDVARLIWLTGVAVLGAPLVWRTVRDAAHGHFASDVVASLSIVGALALDQPLAGLVIVLMQRGGEALDQYAEGRASAAVRALEAAAPSVAHLIDGAEVRDVAATDVAVGDVLLVRPGDLVPCDGEVLDGESELDASSLTGEAVPVRATAGTSVMSGSLNGVGSFRMRATAPAASSQYARIVELVRTAQSSKAPLQRVADRYAVWFTPITLVVCAVAVALTHDWMRALAVLVVATPCPLILATPVAFIGGVNRAARRMVIVRNGGALERLAAVTVAVFDKTGTLTAGKPRFQQARMAPGFDQDAVLRLTAATEQHASHLLARVLVDAVTTGGVALPASDDNVEAPGSGVRGVVEGHAIRVGARNFVVATDRDEADVVALELPGPVLRAYVSVDGRVAAVLEFADEIRPELPDLIAALDRAGIRRVILLSGDHAPVATALAATVGIREAHGDLLPADKAEFIAGLQRAGEVVLMVGDGTNDAPALTTADVGIALAAHGGGITAEAADVIVLVDSLDRVADALAIGRRTMRIARQSIRVGLGLSALGMIAAAFGLLPPIAGAVFQEVIDVAVILNALRTSMVGREPQTPAADHGAKPQDPPRNGTVGIRTVSTVLS